MDSLLVSRQEAAELLGIGIRTLDSLISAKQLRHRRIGKRILIDRGELLRFAKGAQAKESAAKVTQS